MRILLIPPKNNYPIRMPYINIEGQGFPYIAGALKKAGHEVFGVNMNYKWCFHSAPSELAILIKKAIWNYEPQLIGVGGLSENYSFINDAIYYIRKFAPNIPIVCGGGIITFDHEYIFTKLRPDFAIIGEGEETIVKLANCIENNGNIANISNIAYWEDGNPKYTKFEPPNTKIEELPWPDYSPFEFEKYLESFNQTDAFYTHTRTHPRIMPITLGRSCVYKCTFCVHNHPNNAKYRERDIDNAIEEIIYFYNKYQFNILFIYDEVFSIKKERVIKFCRKIKEIKENLNMDFDWTCDLRVNNVDEDMLKEMKEAGCIFIGYGLESASQKILNSMKKGITVDQIRRAIRLTNKAGIGVQGRFIFGDVAETPSTIQETIDFFNKHCKDLMVSLSSPIYPYPGSEIFQYCIDKRIIRNKESFYSNLRPYESCIVNMTNMSDNVFLNYLNKIREIMNSETNFKKASIISCTRTNEFAKIIFPPWRRRILYNVEAICPHCRKLVVYLVPLSVKKSGYGEKFITYCVKCHKRFIILPQDNSPQDKFKKVKKVILNLLPCFMRNKLIRVLELVLYKLWIMKVLYTGKSNNRRLL